MFRSRTIPLCALALASIGGSAVAQTVVEDQRLTEPTLLGDDRYGAAVDTSLGRMVVGAPNHDANGLQSGAVFIYASGGDGTWTPEQTLLSSDLAPNDLFGSSVCVQGGRLVVGAPRRDVGVFDEGAAYEFVRQGDGTWLETDRFSAQDGTPGDRFGESIAFDGDYAVVGAPADDPGGQGSAGSAYVFERQPSGDWLQIEKLTSPAPGVNRRFGRHVEIIGPFVVVGQEAANAGEAGLDRLFIYLRQGDDFVLDGTIASPTPGQAGAQRFGIDFDLDAPRLIVGDPDSSAGGRAHVYERVAGSWVLTDTIDAAPEVSEARVGASVALNGTTAVLGAPGDGVFEGRAVLMLESVNGGWRELADVEPDVRSGVVPDEFGACVEMDEEGLVIGAPVFTAQGLATGSAFAFRRGMLMHGHTQLDVGGGAQQDFLMLAGPQNAVKFHWIVGSATGTTPGVQLAPSVLVPLVPDAYGISTVFNAGQPPLVGSIGLLDGDGVSTRSFVVPAGLSPALAGLTLHHAYLVYDPFTLFIEASSNAVSLTLVP